MPQPLALRAIRAWLTLEEARARYDRDLKARLGLTGLELALLRILAESKTQRLADLRRSLALHPATLGQTLDRLVTRGLCTRTRDPADGRAWVVAVTPRGRARIAKAPLAGPVRLRTAPIPALRLRQLARAFEDAVVLFGLEPWANPSSLATPLDPGE